VVHGQPVEAPEKERLHFASASTSSAALRALTMAIATPWAQSDPNPSENYEPKATMGEATKAGMQSAGAGLFVATVQNALGTHGNGAAGVFTRYGSTIGMFGA
jgi:hypothetical protein